MSDEAVRDAMKDAAARAHQIQKRLRAEQRLRGEDDGYDHGDDAQVSPAMGFGSMLSGRSGLFGTAMLAAAFYFFFMRGRGGGGGSSGWGSYYLFWIVAPALLAAVSSHPAFLVVIVVGLVARRWLPDPILFFKHQARVRSLQADIDANPSNATARRDLAKIWLEKHRPRRALPLLEQAIAREITVDRAPVPVGGRGSAGGQPRQGRRGAGHRHPPRTELPVRRGVPARGGRADRARPLGRRRRRARALRQDQQLQHRSALQAAARLQGAQGRHRRAEGQGGSARRLADVARLPAPQAARLVPA